jgi:hypothetical protein
VNGDGRLDLAIASLDAGSVSVLLGKGDGTFRKPVTYAAGSGTAFVGVTDLNADGKPDLATANRRGGPAGHGSVAILLGHGDGTFDPAVFYEAGNGPNHLVVADVNGDGKRDVVVADSFASSVSVLPGKGDGTFGSPTTFATGTTPWQVSVGDFDGDGHLDIASANAEDDTITVLMGDGHGGFGSATTYAVGSDPHTVLVADFDNDGWSDLAVVCSLQDTVSILVNARGPNGRTADPLIR